MHPPSTDYHSSLLEDLRDPHEAMAYLLAALEEGRAVFVLALRDVAEAHGMLLRQE